MSLSCPSLNTPLDRNLEASRPFVKELCVATGLVDIAQFLTRARAMRLQSEATVSGLLDATLAVSPGSSSRFNNLASGTASIIRPHQPCGRHAIQVRCLDLLLR